ncbi:VWA domain-containing protein [Bacillus timonensis]|uniref:VWA domain-containing protein n=1 Tax=Bacillus timonensis TaxID=1033734 RepID=A0A4S3PRL4_9BACI|nr:VWA domain-containing protein [Bacillus timonensis]THE12320.1 VWA domain-containing protein [Bacillus timonensis]
MDDLSLKSEELLNNPSTRMPICLVLDASGSMTGNPLKQLRLGLQQLFNDLLQNEVSKASVELCIITFGEQVKTVLEFQPIKPTIRLKIATGGASPMGEAMVNAISEVKNRVALYKAHGLPYYQPWIVLLSDGTPTDEIEDSIAQTVNGIKNGDFTLFPIGIGDHADLEILERFSPARPPLVLSEVKFKEFFSWLSESVNRVSESQPFEQIELPPIEDWHELKKK